MAINLCLIEVVLLAVLSPQFGAVTGNKFSPDQVSESHSPGRSTDQVKPGKERSDSCFVPNYREAH